MDKLKGGNGMLAPTEQGPIFQEIEMLSESIACIDDELRKLRNIFDPVLSQEQPVDEDPVYDNSRTGSQLLDTISQLNARLRVCIGITREVIDRCDL